MIGCQPSQAPRGSHIHNAESNVPFEAQWGVSSSCWGRQIPYTLWIHLSQMFSAYTHELSLNTR